MGSILWDKHGTAGSTESGQRIRIWRHAGRLARVVEIAEPPGGSITARFTALPTQEAAIAFAEQQIGATS